MRAADIIISIGRLIFSQAAAIICLAFSIRSNMGYGSFEACSVSIRFCRTARFPRTAPTFCGLVLIDFGNRIAGVNEHHIADLNLRRQRNPDVPAIAIASATALSPFFQQFVPYR
jgi:hypothetical protein